jgi:hypothetical protein
VIPREVMEGETRQQWYPLMGRQANAQENQGDILIVMSFVVNIFIREFKRYFLLKEYSKNKIIIINLAKN